MAELKNEGLPYRLYREHPDIVPTGWDGIPAPTATVDYLAPAYLDECRRWYDAVLPVIADRLHPDGPVIALQLDNEIGMLAWISNSPDLTDGALAEFWSWLRTKHGDDLARRYPVDARRSGRPGAARSSRPPRVGPETCGSISRCSCGTGSPATPPHWPRWPEPMGSPASRS